MGIIAIQIRLNPDSRNLDHTRHKIGILAVFFSLVAARRTMQVGSIFRPESRIDIILQISIRGAVFAARPGAEHPSEFIIPFRFLHILIAQTRVRQDIDDLHGNHILLVHIQKPCVRFDSGIVALRRVYHDHIVFNRRVRIFLHSDADKEYRVVRINCYHI